jgi:parallel beta-helix repeat protein
VVLVGDWASARAATINVPADQPTIQDGINAASSGDIVLVAPGTYSERIALGDPPIKVVSASGPAVTTITGNGVGPVVNIGGTSTLAGFTITGGVNTSNLGDGGGVLVLSGSPTIFGNIITGNSACDGGGGIAVEFSSPTIQSNTITNNNQASCSGGVGGGGILLGGAGAAMILSNTISKNSWTSGDGGGISLFAAGNPVILNNLISGNLAKGAFNGGRTPIAAGGGIAMVNHSDALIEQNLIVNNNADIGAGVYFAVPSGSNGPLLLNNTIFGNSATQAVGAAIYASGYDGPVEFFNNLLLAPGTQNVVYCDNTFNPIPPVFENNDVFSSGTIFETCAVNAGQFGNVSADPLFVNSGGGDFHLTSGSPAIDAGLNSEAGFSATDYYGNPRIVAGKSGDSAIVDLGAAEYQPPSPLQTPTPSATPTPVPGQINVPADYPTIQGAIDAASNGEVIRVAPGRYFETINFNGKAVEVLSTAGPAATTIDGHGLGPVVTFTSGETTASKLSGFTITGGLANTGPLYWGGGILIQGASPTITSNIVNYNFACAGGAGIYLSFGSPVIQSNVISNNEQFANSLGACSGGNGGGIGITGSGSAQIIGNTISGNSWTSGNGGGIDLSSAGTPMIMNNTISHNLATGVFGATPEATGGGISVDNNTAATLIQNLVINNSADWGGGIYLAGYGSSLLVNNTVAGNTSTQDLGSALYIARTSSPIQLYNNLLIGEGTQDALYCASGSPTLITNDTFSESAEAIAGSCASLAGTSGNISADPMFKGVSTNDYHLLGGSPAIDAGTNSAPDLPGEDFYGNPRIVAGYIGDSAIVDMGISEAPAGEIKPTPTVTSTPTTTATPTVTSTPTATATPTATPTPVNSKLQVTPHTLHFEKTAIGQTSKSERVELCNPRSNRQDAPILIEGAAVSGPFVVDAARSTCHAGTSLNANAKCQFALSYVPTASIGQIGTFTINNNSVAGPTVVVLRGKGKQ